LDQVEEFVRVRLQLLGFRDVVEQHRPQEFDVFGSQPQDIERRDGSGLYTS
jgi:hypothetical protein